MRLRAFEAVAKVLDAAHVRYIVAGGLAVNAHGYLRFTADIDLVIALDTRRREQKMSESDKTVDWSKTTFEGSRREQLRRWHALSLRQRLEALDRLSDLARPFEQQRTGQAGTAHPPQTGVHPGAVQEPPAEYGKSADQDMGLPGCAPESRDPTKKRSGERGSRGQRYSATKAGREVTMEADIGARHQKRER